MYGPTPCHTLWRRKVKESLEFDQGSTHDSCEGGEVYKVLVRKFQGKRQIRKPRSRQ